MSWEIREGDCLESLRAMPAGSVQCCVTSPPYWGLRDYGHGDQLGMEETPDLFVANMVKVFAGVKRVLRDDGTLWLNLGDSYASSPTGRDTTTSTLGGGKGTQVEGGKRPSKIVDGLKSKDLVGIPWRVAFALRADGWYLRSEIIWAKPNPMPESVTDRPTKAHEQVFLLSKSPRYFYDADAVREAHAGPLHAPGNIKVDASRGDANRMEATWGNPAGRNKRTVWTVSTQPFSGAHFATFPPKLIEPMVLAGSPPKCCGECGAPWERVVERTVDESALAELAARRSVPKGAAPGKLRNDGGFDAVSGQERQRLTRSETTGWEPTCDHNDDTGSSVVLDPFSGSGTTGMVALRHDRSYIGIELNPEYAELSRNRIRDDAPLLNTHLEAA